MAKIISTWPNASTLVNGVKFEPHTDGMISEEIEDQSVIDMFLSIQKYKLEPAPDALLVELREQVAGLGVKVNSKWGVERLQNELRSAVQAQADKDAETARAAAEAETKRLKDEKAAADAAGKDSKPAGA